MKLQNNRMDAINYDLVAAQSIIHCIHGTTSQVHWPNMKHHVFSFPFLFLDLFGNTIFFFEVKLFGFWKHCHKKTSTTTQSLRSTTVILESRNPEEPPIERNEPNLFSSLQMAQIIHYKICLSWTCIVDVLQEGD